VNCGEDRGGVREEVENRAMGIDDVAERLVAFFGLRSGERDVKPHSGEPGAYGWVDAEQSCGVEVALRGHIDLVERDVGGLGVETEYNNLAGDKRTERDLDRACRYVVTRQSCRLVDDKLVLASGDPACLGETFGLGQFFFSSSASITMMPLGPRT
jgi:hypothetical protein